MERKLEIKVDGFKLFVVVALVLLSLAAVWIYRDMKVTAAYNQLNQNSAAIQYLNGQIKAIQQPVIPPAPDGK